MKLTTLLSFITLLTLYTTSPLSAANLSADEERREEGRRKIDYGYTWEEFVEDFVLYANETAEEEETTNHDLQEWLETLEDIHQHPININTAKREELLQLGFLSDTQVDSIISRRDHYQSGLRSVGELMTIRELSYTDRAWLSLLVSFGAKENDNTHNPTSQTTRWRTTSNVSTSQEWTSGKHEVSAYASVPLYNRAGFTIADDDKNPAIHHFLGSKFSHTLRYRYNWRRRLMYGATVQQDAGEPWGRYGAIPWDYGSLHFYRKDQNIEFAVGDYKLSIGQGLALGYGGWNLRSSLLTDVKNETTRLRPHTGTDESRFLRGAAATLHFGNKQQWSITAFGSWRRVDGTVKGMNQDNNYDACASDTITAWKTDGLHRTLQETQKRDVATQWTTGGRLGFKNTMLNIGLHAVWRHYDKVYWPAIRTYNTHYLRGKDAFTFSTDWTIKGKRWSLQGEAALDRNAAYAITTTARWKPMPTLLIAANARLFSPDFVSPGGQTLQLGSQIQNEQGGTISIKYTGWYRWTFHALFDLAHHPEPTYHADDSSWQMDAMAELGLHSSLFWHHNLRYKLHRYQQNLTGYADIEAVQVPWLTWRTTQHLRWQSVWGDHKKITVSFGGNLAVYHSEGSAYDKKNVTITGGGMKLGGLLSARTTYTCTQRLKLSTALVGFIADDYTVRCYVSLPQQQGVVSVPSFYGRGFFHTALLDCSLSHNVTASVQYAIVRYFDRETIGTGINLINSPWKSDISFSAQWRL